MPSNHLILCRPLLLPPSIFPSIRVFPNESVLRIKWPEYWGFCYSINPSNEYSGLISFRMDWLNLLAVQGALKSVLQYHSSKASILRCSAFFIVQLSHPYMTTGKTIALTRWTSVGKVMPLPFNMLSRLVIMPSPSAVILEPPKIKSLTVSTVSPSICHEVMGPSAMILVFCMLSFKPTFSLSPFTFIKRFFSSSLSAIRVVSSAYSEVIDISPGNFDSSLCFIQSSIQISRVKRVWFFCPCIPRSSLVLSALLFLGDHTCCKCRASGPTSDVLTYNLPCKNRLRWFSCAL